ncbi:MAG: ATP-binding protein [Candidatus Aminicenantales bacterium]
MKTPTKATASILQSHFFIKHLLLNNTRLGLKRFAGVLDPKTYLLSVGRGRPRSRALGEARETSRSCGLVSLRVCAVIRLRAFLNERGRILIQVRDNGPGIPPENLEKIFVPFFSTKATGSGIGLSLSRQIMRLHRGPFHPLGNGRADRFYLEFLIPVRRRIAAMPAAANPNNRKAIPGVRQEATPVSPLCSVGLI